MADEHGTAVSIIERSDPHHQAGMSPAVKMGMEILRQNPSPEALRELLAVQKEWEANEARKTFTSALVQLKRDLPTVIARDKTVDFTGNSGKRTHYTHASLAGAMEAVTGPLTQHGFSLTWRPSTANGQVTVICRLTHAGGHYEETDPVSAPIDSTGNKSQAQGVASTITLLQRYTALSLLGIATADMEEPQGQGDQSAPAGSPSEQINGQRNLKAVAWLKKQGRTREEAEAFLMRTVAEWTAADLERLKEWAKSNANEPGGAA